MLSIYGDLHQGLRRAERDYIARQCDLACQASHRQDIRSLYRILRELTNTGKPAPREYASIPTSERHRHFKELFAAARPPADQALMTEMAALADQAKAQRWRKDIPSTPPTIDEINPAISKMNAGRTPGAEGTDAELLQYSRDALAPFLERMFATLWSHNHLPPDWTRTEILPILKKGKPDSRMDSYLPISIVSLISKVLMHILRARLAPMVEDTIGDYQCGFRPGRSTTDANFTL